MALNSITSFLGSIIQTAQVKTVKPVKTVQQSQSYNPFANPFMNAQTNNDNASYGKNQPVHGGFFAGYYNGKPNIVGTRLFLEV